jgi:hypothetical protein
VLHPPRPAFPFFINVRNSTNSPAVHPPRIAVSVKYVLSLRAAVIARSAPPGIAVILHPIRLNRAHKCQLLTDSSRPGIWHRTHLLSVPSSHSQPQAPATLVFCSTHLAAPRVAFPRRQKPLVRHKTQNLPAMPNQDLILSPQIT